MKKKNPFTARTTLPIITLVPLLLGADAARTFESAPPRKPVSPSRAASGSSAKYEAADAIVGKYRFVGGRADHEARDAAIEDVVSEMNVLVRGIARDRLREANPIPGHITLLRKGDALAIAFDQRRYEARLDGAATEVVGITGDKLSYHVELVPKGVRQKFDGDGGGRTNTLEVQGDGRLDVSVEVRSARLPAPLRYRLAFRRE